MGSSGSRSILDLADAVYEGKILGSSLETGSDVVNKITGRLPAGAVSAKYLFPIRDKKTGNVRSDDDILADYLALIEEAAETGRGIALSGTLVTKTVIDLDGVMLKVAEAVAKHNRDEPSIFPS